MELNNEDHFVLFSSFSNQLFIFLYLAKIFLYQNGEKIRNSIPLRIVAVINRVLIFRGLKRAGAGIFS
jgi:hypothetical protein